jgi:uroporphyrinogen-III synthase
MSSLFISRLKEECPWMSQFPEHTFVAQRLIRFERVTQDQPPPKTEWIFFSSPRSVEFFLPFTTFNEHTPHFAAMGAGTSKAIHDLGFATAFTGTSSDPQIVAEEFKQLLRPATHVLFPIAEESRRSIIQSAKGLNSIPWICYRTVEVPDTIPPCDTLIFSSPSNVRSFFAMNTPLATQNIISFGPSTGSEVNKLLLATGSSVRKHMVLDRVTDERIASAIAEMHSQ